MLIWYSERTTPCLEAIARDGRLYELPPAAVFALPKRYVSFGDFALYDGHKRREAARRTGELLPILVIEGPDDFRHVDEFNDPFYYGMSAEKFKEEKEYAIRRALRYHRITP